MVSGLLYDMVKKEFIALRKYSHEKDQSLKDKDDAIEVHCLVIYHRFHFSSTVLSKFKWHHLTILFLEIHTHMLAKKVYTLTKSMEVESNKMHKEVVSMGKEVPTMQIDKEHYPRERLLTSSKSVNIFQQPI